MEKKVYCLIHPRCKCVKYVVKENVSELEVIRESLTAACKTDAVLAAMIKEKMIVLQKKDTDQEDGWCDLNDSDIVEDKSKIRVLLISTASNNVLTSSSTASFNPENLHAGNSMELDLEVLYAESSNADKNIVVIHECTGASQKMIEKHDNVPSIASEVIESLPLEKTERTFTETLAKSHENKKKDSVNETKKDHLVLKKGSIPYPATLPLLTFDLEERLNNMGIEKSQRQFIRFWGTYLWQQTFGQPSKDDYHNLASAIVSEHPLLSGGSNGNGIVRNQLSTFIRNRRANEKLKINAKKRNHCGNPVGSAPTTKASLPVDMKNMVETDVEKALTELKKCIPGRNISHIKRLLDVTQYSRRPWIEHEAGRITDVVEKYPPLKDYEMIMFECITIIQKKSEDAVFDQIKKLMTELREYYSANEDIKIEKSDTVSSKTEALILAKFCDDMAVRRLKTKISPLFTLKQISTSTQCLVTVENEAPRIVLYIDNEELTQAFIVADEKIRITIPDPTVSKAIGGLVASYYAWHRAFPSGYAGALEFLAFKILQAPFQNNSTAAKFKRKLDNFKTQRNL